MSRFITPPDLDFGDTTAILLKNYSQTDVELIALTAKCTAKDFDIYLYKDDYSEPAWLAHVESMVAKTYNAGENKINEIVEFLQA